MCVLCWLPQSSQLRQVSEEVRAVQRSVAQMSSDMAGLHALVMALLRRGMPPQPVPLGAPLVRVLRHFCCLC